VREHVSDKHVFRIHLSYDVRNALGTLVREHVSDTCLFKRHLLYDVKNAYSTLERWYRILIRGKGTGTGSVINAVGTLPC